ncbi:unnamed protein product [Lactuca virosa]|uniref:DUF659 domain-containing protein n=1 Tax=Lactuca virosa TaxID=75947 RepID=A0AAU9NTB6_9ASTR|nr:unnamed protein product [Lactuca virosa]
MASSQEQEPQGSSTSLDQPPLWDFVTKLDKLAGAGGCWKFKCNLCSETRKGSYTRVRAQLLGIKGYGISICKKATTTDKLNMTKLEDAYEKKKIESQVKEVQLPCEAGVGFKKRKGISTPIERAFGVEIREQMDQKIARMFYTGGLPFNLARNPHYVRAFQFTANNKIDGYVPPGYNKLRTTLLQKEKDNFHKLLEPLRSTWKKKEVINEIGHENVVQIITDNAANCKATGEIIESQFPHIYWTPCVAHTLNLSLKNICSPRNVETNELTYEQCRWIKEVHEEAFTIKNFIMNHNMRLSIFTKFTLLRLLSVADTRFSSIIVMLKRLKLIKMGLQAMVISEEWSSYRLDYTEKANSAKEYILNDDWWDKVAYILSFTGPIYEMIRACDTDKPCLHLVYEMWDSMIEKVKIEIYKKEKRLTSQISCFYDVVHRILMARWAKNNTPLHCLAHSLHPRLFPNGDEYSRVLDEYAMFSMKSGPFEDLTSISKMATMEPKNWWVNFGAQTPFLQTLAFRLLGQPSSSSCAERNCSTYAFIHSLKRNKLTTSRAQDLVYIHNNLRLLSRTPKDDVKMWDVGADAFDSMEDVSQTPCAAVTACVAPSDQLPPTTCHRSPPLPLSSRWHKTNEQGSGTTIARRHHPLPQ